MYVYKNILEIYNYRENSRQVIYNFSLLKYIGAAEMETNISVLYKDDIKYLIIVRYNSSKYKNKNKTNSTHLDRF